MEETTRKIREKIQETSSAALPFPTILFGVHTRYDDLGLNITDKQAIIDEVSLIWMYHIGRLRRHGIISKVELSFFLF